MADISNAYRSEVRDLIQRRIALARKKLLEDNKPAVDRAHVEAEKDPTLIKLRLMQKKCMSLQKIKLEADNNLRKALGELEKFSEANGLTYNRYNVDEDIFKAAEKTALQTAVEKLMLKDPTVGPKLADLGRLEGELSDMLTLALTQSRLRQVVDVFNKKLGIEPSEIEKDILGQPQEITQ